MLAAVLLAAGATGQLTACPNNYIFEENTVLTGCTLIRVPTGRTVQSFSMILEKGQFFNDDVCKSDFAVVSGPCCVTTSVVWYQNQYSSNIACTAREENTCPAPFIDCSPSENDTDGDLSPGAVGGIAAGATVAAAAAGYVVYKQVKKSKGGADAGSGADTVADPLLSGGFL